MHRLIADAEDGVFIDHWDRNGLNNQKYNLRKCTNGQNRWNSKMQENKEVPFKGVSERNSKFRSRITYNGVTKNLGTYDTAKEAADTYDFFAKELFGEFARTNQKK
jgi:hypothetical protein